MIINLGDALEAVILNHSEVQPTQENFLKALKNFFEQNLQEYTTPSFLMEGVITTPYGPIPHISNSGRLASITVLPVTTVEWESIIKPINDKAILEYGRYSVKTYSQNYSTHTSYAYLHSHSNLPKKTVLLTWRPCQPHRYRK